MGKILAEAEGRIEEGRAELVKLMSGLGDLFAVLGVMPGMEVLAKEVLKITDSVPPVSVALGMDQKVFMSRLEQESAGGTKRAKKLVDELVEAMKKRKGEG